MNKQIKKHLLTWLALAVGLGVLAGCARLQSDAGNAKQTESATAPAVALINPKPQVIWGDNPEKIPLSEAFGIKFRVPETYNRWGIPSTEGRAPSIMLLNTPSLEPLSPEKRDCWSYTSIHCMDGVLELGFVHDLNRQVFKDRGVDENNYLNLFKMEPNAEKGGFKWGGERDRASPVHGLEPYYFSFKKAEENRKKENPEHWRYRFSTSDKDFFFNYDEKGNVQTYITCLPGALPNGYIYKNTIFSAKCTQAFTIKRYKMVLYVDYDREYLPQWRQIETSITDLMEQFHQAAQSPKRDK